MAGNILEAVYTVLQTLVSGDLPTFPPICGKIHNGYLSDGYYKVPVEHYRLPELAIVRITKWSIDLDSFHILIRIAKLKKIKEYLPIEVEATCPIEHNPVVNRLLFEHSYQKMRLDV